MKSNSSIDTITKIMAMTMEQMNQRLEKVLKQLDDAIEDRDLAKVDEAIIKAQKFNKISEGKKYEEILEGLNDRIKKIAEEIKPDNELDVDERKDLAGIKKKIKDGKDPFQKTKKVVDSLSKKGVNQEDLKLYKETQKNDNIAQIEAIKENNKELAISIQDIEIRYIAKIEKNDESIKIIQDIKKQKDLLESLDPSTDAELINATKVGIKDKISELAAKGVNVNAIQNFESNPSVIDAFESTKIGELNNESNTIAQGITQDKYISGLVWNQYDLASVTNAKDLKDKYKEMVGTRQKNASKITTLEAENRHIDNTIRTLEKEEKIKGIAYNEDGTERLESEIARTVLNNDSTRQRIENSVNNRFDGNFFKRFGARMDYYKEIQGVGSFKAFWKAFASKTKNVKTIATASEAVRTGRGMADKAISNMGKRQSDFKETIKREAVKKMSKDATLTENDIRDNAIEEAYKSAFREDDGR